jgi:glutathione S-transferase
MSQSTQLELVSFDICPYVQRSVITLKHKKIDFKITYIDLANPPEWFNKASPLGKVPLLLVRNSSTSEPTVLFESAVINEYIDETTSPQLLPRDSLQRARERAWIAVSGELMTNFYPIMSSRDEAEIKEAKQEIWDILSKVEEAVSGGSFFTSTFSLVDAAFAPMFQRFLMLKPFRDDPEWKKLPKTRKWAEALLALPEVRDSVVPDFKERYVSFLTKREFPIASQIV